MGVPEKVREALANRYTIERELGRGGMGVPAPTFLIRKPSASSCEKASSTVLRDTPRSSASVRDEGSRVSGARLPSRIVPRILS